MSSAEGEPEKQPEQGPGATEPVRAERRQGDRRKGGRRREDREEPPLYRSPRAYTFLILPDHGGQGRSIEISAFKVRFALWSAVVLTGVLFMMALTWSHFVAESVKVQPLEQRVAHLERENRQVEAIMDRFQEVEQAYARLRAIFGTQEGVPDLWLPPTSGRAGAAASAEGARLPTSWPLTERGFVTQPLLAGAGGDHPGVDVAVPTDSYIRAAGAGRISDLGEDPILGRFLVIDHADGYQSLYAHASSILVELGDEVRQNEVVALSGSSGRSTAPHLHFEILLHGERVDPLSMVTQP